MEINRWPIKPHFKYYCISLMKIGLSPIFFGFFIGIVFWIKFVLKTLLNIETKWGVQLFNDHMPFSSMALLLFFTSLLIFIAGSFRQGKFKKNIIKLCINFIEQFYSFAAFSSSVIVGLIGFLVVAFFIERSQHMLLSIGLFVFFSFLLLLLPFLLALMCHDALKKKNKQTRIKFMLISFVYVFIAALPLLIDIYKQLTMQST